MTDAEGAPRGNLRVLAVVEAPAVRVFLEQLLAPEHRLRACATGQEALAVILRQEFDVVICGAHLPDLTCSVFQHALEGARPSLTGRIVYLVAGPVDRNLQSFLAAPGRIVVDAPMQRATLLDALRRAMER